MNVGGVCACVCVQFVNSVARIMVILGLRTKVMMCILQIFFIKERNLRAQTHNTEGLLRVALIAALGMLTSRDFRVLWPA